MNFEQMSHTFELPKTPASTIDGHGYDSSDDDVEIIDVSVNFKVANVKIDNPRKIESMQLQQMGIATPPQSPPYPGGMPPQPVQNSMPVLSQLLSTPGFEAPQGYMISVPCYLCKQPFNNIDRLKEHLSMHADMMQQTVQTGATELPRESPQNRELVDTNILYSCQYCGKIVNSKYKLGYHLRNYHREAEAQRRAQEVSRCHICRKQYKRKSYLHLHLKVKHGVIQANDQTSPSSETSVTTNSTESSITKEMGKRRVWTTHLLNALAAAQYNPAKEGPEKYMSSTEAAKPSWHHLPTFKPQPKYPPRSPFFNPNLWFYDPCK